jgi:CHAT domain-containing protein/tetratricopeptide (TPR) repeat protein
MVLNSFAHIFPNFRLFPRRRIHSTWCLTVCLFLPGAHFQTVAQDVASTELNEQINKLYQQGNYTQAIRLAQESLDAAQTTFGVEDLRTSARLSALAGLYENLGRYQEAEPFFKQALAIQIEKLGSDHAEVAISWSALATLYVRQGRFGDAEPLYKRALTTLQKLPEPPYLTIASLLNNLGQLYKLESRYPDAEPIFKAALEIRQKILPPGSQDIAQSLNNLAGVYEDEGRHADAERLLQQSLVIWQKALGPDHEEVATAQNNLAELYYSEGRYAEAESRYRQALSILQNAPNPKQENVASLLGNLGELYQAEKRYAEAEKLLEQALAIDTKALPPDHPALAADLNNLAALYSELGRYPKAEKLLLQALAIRQKVLGPENLDTGTSQLNLGALYQAWGRPRDAQPYFGHAFRILALQFGHQFAYMSERDRLDFLDTYSGIIPSYLSFAYTYHNQDNELTGAAYDLLLWEKGLVADSVATQRARLVASGDAAASKLFDQLAAKRNEYATLAGAQPPNTEEWKHDLDQLQFEANGLEEQLVRHSATFAESKRLAQPSWRDIQRVLGKDEAAVEFVRFEFNDGKKWTNETKYAALVLTPQRKGGPVLIELGNSKALERALRPAYYQRIAPPPDGTASSSLDCLALKPAPPVSFAPVTSVTAGDSLAFYESFWRLLEPALAGAKHIYISTDGELNQVALGLIPTPNGSLLMEKYDLHLVNRTADLLRPVAEHSTKSAVLFANPDFNLEATGYRKSLADLGSQVSGPQMIVVPSIGESFRTLGGCTQLPEVYSLEIGVTHEIAPLLRQYGWTTKTYVEKQALVETVQQIRAPRLLHIATHGDFLPDPVATAPVSTGANNTTPSSLRDSMIRSRLFFAGANQTLAAHRLPADLSDGILTAYQASTLNLQGTELVVLSACETGRGETQDGEGVFGLRRAFQEAGAESVLMTLWEVPAIETQELLNKFYRHWLADGMDKHHALLAAQDDERGIVRKRYGSEFDYYWGAFILVGR